MSASRRRALLALVLIAPAPSFGVMVALTLQGSAVGTVLWAVSKVWLFGLPLLWHLFVDRQPISLSPLRGGGLGVGLVTGGAIAAVIAGAYVWLGPTWIEPEQLRTVLEPHGLTDPAVFFAGSAYWVLVNSVLEEYVYRWFIFTRCLQLTGNAVAVSLSAAIFVVHHTIAMAHYFGPAVNVLASVGIFVGGALWSWLYRRYGSIWVPYASHAIVDVAVFGVGAMILFST